MSGTSNRCGLNNVKSEQFRSDQSHVTTSSLEFALARLEPLVGAKKEDCLNIEKASTTSKCDRRSWSNNCDDVEEEVDNGRAGADSIEDFFQHVEIVKRPGQTLGFYIREGNGAKRAGGVFISRVEPGGFIQERDLLRVGDEILAVNGVDIGSAALDDVVILMSIPTTLRLTIRRRAGKLCDAFTTALSQTPAQKPVVVLKHGVSDSRELEVPDSPLDQHKSRGGACEEIEFDSEFELALDSAVERKNCFIDTGLNAQKMHRRESRYSDQQRLLEYKNVYLDQLAGEDSNDSGLSSENSANSREPIPTDNIPQRAVHFAPENSNVSRRSAQGRISNSSRLRQNTNSSRSHFRRLPRSPTIELRDMAVQCDTTLPQLHAAESHIYQQQLEDGLLQTQEYGAEFDPSFMMINSKAHYFKNEFDYNSDSELHQPLHGYVGRRRPGPSYSSGEEDVLTTASCSPRHTRNYHLYNTQAHLKMPPSDADYFCWNQRLQELSLQKEALTRRAMMTTTTAKSRTKTLTPPLPSNSSSSARQNYSHEVHDLQADVNYPVHPLYPGSQSPDYGLSSLASCSGWVASFDEFGRPLHLPIATDSLKQPCGTAQKPNIFSSANPALGSYTSKEDVLALRGAQKFKVKDWEMARFAAKYDKQEFRQYIKARQMDASTISSDASVIDRISGVDGLIYIHIIAGVGLPSAHSVLRDLYCVLEVDQIRKARTMIRTSTECFEWDELFDMELICTRQISFLLYQWDPHSKHRLCFHTNIDVISLLQSFRQRFLRAEKLALRLEPKGVLYIEISYLELRELYQRLAVSRPGAYFGVPLDTIVRREGAGVPLLVRACVEEVERRGLDVVGIYRLTGSMRCRQQLKEAFERQPHDVDLSADKVSDIHAVTGLLKDYLRTLPEPLFTNSLYRMVLDAMHVSIPGDPQSAAKLMLSILDCLPPPNQETLILVLNHLKRVSLRAETNRMSAEALAVSFGALLLYPSPEAARDLEPTLLRLDRMSEVLKYLLEIWAENRNVRKGRSNLHHELREVEINSSNRCETSRGRVKDHRPLSAPTCQQTRSSSLGTRSIRNAAGLSEKNLQNQIFRSASQDRRGDVQHHIDSS